MRQVSFFSNPQLVWLIEQLVSSEVIFTVKLFSKIFLIFVFFAAIFVAKVNAQPSSQTGAGDSTVVSNAGKFNHGGADCRTGGKRSASPAGSARDFLYRAVAG